MKPAKHLVSRAFDQAAATYDSAAEVQRLACQRLAEKLADPGRGLILDAGCGTGFGLRLLLQRFPDAQGLGLDLSPAMLARAQPLNTLIGDIEHLPLADASIDLYWSSLTAQWCDLEQLLREARRVLRPAGQLALSTLGPATFGELRTAFAASDAYAHTLNFLSPEAVLERAAHAGLTGLHLERQTVITHHENFRALLASIKAIGANQVGSGRRRGLMTRNALQRAESAYEKQRQPQGLPLTYELIFLMAPAPQKNL